MVRIDLIILIGKNCKDKPTQICKNVLGLSLILIGHDQIDSMYGTFATHKQTGYNEEHNKCQAKFWLAENSRLDSDWQIINKVAGLDQLEVETLLLALSSYEFLQQR